MTKLSNEKIAGLLKTIANIYESENNDYYRSRAYRRASNIIKKLPYALAKCPVDTDFTKIPSVGKAIANQIKSILLTGNFIINNSNQDNKPFFSELKLVPGLGPKRRKILYKNNIFTIKQLRENIENGSIKQLNIFSEKLEKSIYYNLFKLRKYEKSLKWFKAAPIIHQLLSRIEKLSGIVKVTSTSSYRRKKELVGNIDIIVVTEGKFDLSDIIKLPHIKEIITQRKHYLEVILNSGLKITVHSVLPEQFETYKLYYTGSKKHLTKLKSIAKNKNVTLNKKGVFRHNKKLSLISEEDIYNFLGLDYIVPELREDKGEVAAAKDHSLPVLIEVQDIRGDLHCHTNETDGTENLKTMVTAAQDKGYEYLAITDHSKNLAITHGLDETRLLQQIKQIDKLNSTLKNFRILKSIEIDILKNGTLDLSNDILKELDLCVCSIHSYFNLPKSQQTERIIRAMDNPYFTILGHPTGRLIERRKPYEIDIERILLAAKERGCFMELNAQPYRLDLNDDYCFAAKQLGVKIAISSDAHSIRNLDYIPYGINQARRGWLQAVDVINTLKLTDFLKLIKR